MNVLAPLGSRDSNSPFPLVLIYCSVCVLGVRRWSASGTSGTTLWTSCSSRAATWARCPAGDPPSWRRTSLVRSLRPFPYPRFPLWRAPLPARPWRSFQECGLISRTLDSGPSPLFFSALHLQDGVHPSPFTCLSVLLTTLFAYAASAPFFVCLPSPSSLDLNGAFILCSSASRMPLPNDFRAIIWLLVLVYLYTTTRRYLRNCRLPEREWCIPVSIHVCVFLCLYDIFLSFLLDSIALTYCGLILSKAGGVLHYCNVLLHFLI